MALARGWRSERRRLTDVIDRVYHRLDRPLPLPLERIVDGVFLHFSMNVFELLRFPLLSASDLERKFAFDGLGNFERAFSRGRGVILVVPHLGNWELLGAAIAHRGYPLHSFFLAQKENDIGSVLDHFREFSRIILHDRDRAGMSALKALKRGAVLGMISDQDGGNNGVYADFLGHWVSNPAGPANWSLKTGAALVPLYSLRNGWSARYTARFLPERQPEAGSSHREQVVARTLGVMRWMEELILRNPHQYLWFYDRFKPRHQAYLGKLERDGAEMVHGEAFYPLGEGER